MERKREASINSRLHIKPLREEHLVDLAQVLRHSAVYEHLGGRVPSEEEFVLGLRRALKGPPSTRPKEIWLNYLVTLVESGEVIGRLESTINGSVAEVAFLFSPSTWGVGFAQEGLEWLHKEIHGVAGNIQFWATTVPENLRCQALLRSAGYVEIAGNSAPPLTSYDEGDLVFSRRAETRVSL
jgi:RimJ/RimL family protein N-acetyltransferase